MKIKLLTLTLLSLSVRNLVLSDQTEGIIRPERSLKSDARALNFFGMSSKQQMDIQVLEEKLQTKKDELELIKGDLKR